MTDSDAITRFEGAYYFLSNFYERGFLFDGLYYQNAEAAFQAQKDPARRDEFLFLRPFDAKSLGRRVRLRPDWEEVKIDVMREVLRAKFDQLPDLKEKLLATGNRILVEGNNHGDTTWGQVNGKGSNYLGRLLMGLRTAYRKGGLQ